MDIVGGENVFVMVKWSLGSSVVTTLIGYATQVTGA